jgi:hypothetical protein
LCFFSGFQLDRESCLKSAGNRTKEQAQGEYSRQAEEAMERTEFLRKQVERFLRLAQECTDPKIRRQLVSMADEYQNMLERPVADAQTSKAS